MPTSVSKRGYALHKRASGIDGGCPLYVSLYQPASAFHQWARTSATPCCASERYVLEVAADPGLAAGTARASASSVRTMVDRATTPSIPLRRSDDTLGT